MFCDWIIKEKRWIRDNIHKTCTPGVSDYIGIFVLKLKLNHNLIKNIANNFVFVAVFLVTLNSAFCDSWNSSQSGPEGVKINIKLYN